MPSEPACPSTTTSRSSPADQNRTGTTTTTSNPQQVSRSSLRQRTRNLPLHLHPRNHGNRLQRGSLCPRASSRRSPTIPGPPPNHHATIYSTNPAAIQAITNLRPHAGQSSALDFCNSLTQLFASSRTTRVKIEWCPSEVLIVGIRRCIDLARANAVAPLPLDHQEPNTIAFQRSSTKELAISAWQARWHNSDRRSQAFLALPASPSGKLSPAISGAARGSRAACATLVHLITGHAFIGSYTERFHPRKPTHCPNCGTNPQTVAHVILQCPCFARARATHLIPIAPDLSLRTLFGTEEGGTAMIAFLEDTKACYKPFDPG